MKDQLVKYHKFILEMVDRSGNPWMEAETALELKASELKKDGFYKTADEICQTLDELKKNGN